MAIEKVNFNVREFMEYMGIKRTLAYEIVNDPNFYPAFRIGRKILINIEKLNQWISEQIKNRD